MFCEEGVMTQISRFNALMDLQGVVVGAQRLRLGQSNVLFSCYVSAHQIHMLACLKSDLIKILHFVYRQSWFCLCLDAPLPALWGCDADWWIVVRETDVFSPSFMLEETLGAKLKLKLLSSCFSCAPK